MKNIHYKYLLKVGIIFILFSLVNITVQAQLTLTFNTQLNYICNGDPCDNYTYTGPKVLINEVMISPKSYDGSIYGDNGGVQQGEWIELYNPNLCDPVDVSCYYLGNNSYDAGDFGGSFRIPIGTIIPPNGFLIIRGSRSIAVDSNLLVQNGGNTIELIADTNICLGGGYRFWLPNAGGWLAVYDEMGVPQDAISWGELYSHTSPCLYCKPCVPSSSGCYNVGSLVSYFSIIPSRKTYITPIVVPDNYGFSWMRIPDGLAWDTLADTSTMGYCNTICNQLPIANCNGQATAIVSGGVPPYSYSWNDPQGSNTATASGLCAGLYCVTVQDSNNDTITGCVAVYNFPIAVFDSISPVCVNANSFNLSPYVSPAGGIFSGSGITGSSFDPSAAGVGSHLLTYIYADTNGCSDTVSRTVIVNPIPNVSIAPNPVEICYGDSVSLSASGASSYSWLPALGLNTDTGAFVTASPSTTTTYIVTGSSNGCVNSDTITVNVHPLPQIIPPSPTTICQGNSVILSAGGASTYTWSPSSGLNITSGSTVIANPGTTTTYTITGDVNGCTDTAHVTVNVIPVPTISVLPNVSTICLGDSVTLSASGNALTYTWTPSNGLNTNTGNVVIANPSATTTYTVTGSINGCTNTAEATITVVSAPTISVLPITTSICLGDSVTLTASGNSLSYSWTPTNGLNTNMGNVVIANPSATTTYTVTGSINGCTNTAEVIISVSPPPVLNVNSPGICFGDSVTLSASGASTYTWWPPNGLSATSGSSVIAFPATTTSYIVTGESNGCTASATATVTVYTSPTISISPNITITSGSSAFLNATGGTTYLWVPTTGLSCYTCPNPVASPDSTTTYCVYVSDTNGCSGSACVTVFVDIFCGEVFVPNAFSPDNNNQNDQECVYGNCIQTMYFAIYDRWGERVFETNDQNECWDGTYRGKKLNSAVFVYYLKATLINGEKVEKSGNISLIR